jgi:uncharacterized protein (TIGR00369 family)
MTDDIRERFPWRPNVNDELGIQMTEATRERVVLSVEVGPKVHQPFGILHGGVSALLAEGAASVGGALNAGPGEVVVGTELNCSHLRSMTSGTLTATATPIRLGRRVHVWGIDLRDQDGRQICVARCTLQVIAAPTPA